MARDVIPHVVTRRPKTPAPPALQEVLDELAAFVLRGALTDEIFGALMSRALDAAQPIEDEDEREAHLAPLWSAGETSRLFLRE